METRTESCLEWESLAAKLRLVLAHWPQVPEHSMLEPVAVGATNHVFRVHGEPEAVLPVWYLRQYRTQDVSKIQREHRLLCSLASTLETVVVPVTSSAGETLVSLDGHYFALFPEARGQSVPACQLTLDHACSAGEALGRLHYALNQACSESELSEYSTITLRWPQQEWVRRLEKVIEAIEQRLPSLALFQALFKPLSQPLLPIQPLSLIQRQAPIKPLPLNPLYRLQRGTDAWALRRAIRQKAYLASSRSLHYHTPTSPLKLIHGDYHHYNVFFDGSNQVSGIIDWDLVGRMPLGYEVVRACMYMFQMDVERSLAFIRSYLTVMPLSFAELSDGAKSWGIYADHHVWALEEVYLKGNLSAKKFIPHHDFEAFQERWKPIGDQLSSSICFQHR